MKESTKKATKATKPQVKVKDMPPKKDAKGGMMMFSKGSGPVKNQSKTGGPHTSF